MSNFLCRRCGGTKFYQLQRRNIRRCVTCRYDQSDTSRTPWHASKLSNEKIRNIANTLRTATMLSTSNRLSCEYKTIRRVKAILESEGLKFRPPSRRQIAHLDDAESLKHKYLSGAPLRAIAEYYKTSSIYVIAKARALGLAPRKNNSEIHEMVLRDLTALSSFVDELSVGELATILGSDLKTVGQLSKKTTAAPRVSKRLRRGRNAR